MIRTIVTLANKWYRLTLLTPTEIVENRYPNQIAKKVWQHDYAEKQQLIRQQKVNAERANASPLEVEFINLREEYRNPATKMTKQEYEYRLQQLNQKRYQQSMNGKVDL